MFVSTSGNARMTKKLVTKMFHVKMGMRNMVMPGARKQMMVVMKFTPVNKVPIPDTSRPMTHKSPPVPTVPVVESGA